MMKPNDDMDNVWNELEGILGGQEPTPEPSGDKPDGEEQDTTEIAVRKEFDHTKVCENEAMPLIADILTICKEHAISAQFILFTKATQEDGVHVISQSVHMEERPEVCCATLMYRVPHAMSHLVAMLSQNPIIQIQKQMGGEESTTEPFDKEDVYKSEIRELIHKLMSVVEDHSLAIQWGMVTKHCKNEEGQFEREIRMATVIREELFNACQMGAATMCYHLPFHILTDVYEVMEQCLTNNTEPSS